MTRYEIEQRLDALYIDLDVAIGCDETTARMLYNVNYGEDAIQAIKEEIDTYKTLLEEEIKPSTYELELAGERYGYDYY